VTERLPGDASGIARAVELLRAGGIVAFPTDTVYGVGVTWERADRLPGLFALKDRPAEKRIPALVASLDQVVEGGWAVDDRARALADRFWPGPLTLVLGGSSGPGDATQGFRVPDHGVALELISAAGPLLATSANLSGEPDTLDADDVLIAFATRRGELAAVVDGGRVPGGAASTVVDLTASPARILREGPLSRGDLEPLVEIA
jgi:L-threonylcarbamoyladenylate synthase